MKSRFFDCLMFIGTAFSLRGDQGVQQMSRPLLQDVFTTNVNVSITLTKLSFEDVNNMDVKFTFLLNQRWTDPRLGANHRTKKLAVNGQIWRPYLTVTEGESNVSNDDKTQFWRGTAPDGEILYSEKVVLNTVCTRNLQKFPFDSQKCSIKLGTYRFPKEEVDLIWDEIPIDILTGEYLQEFKLVDVNTYSEVDIRQSGNFTVLVAQITVKRYYEHYIFCTFAPCTFLVIVSYFIFWIKTQHIQIRYFISGLNLTLLLYFYYHSTCTRIILPYLKALDVYILICIFFTLVTLFENIIVDLTFREHNDEEYGGRIFQNAQHKHRNGKNKIIDRTCYIIYPIVYVCVILFYCMIYIEQK